MGGCFFCAWIQGKDAVFAAWFRAVKPTKYKKAPPASAVQRCIPHCFRRVSHSVKMLREVIDYYVSVSDYKGQ